MQTTTAGTTHSIPLAQLLDGEGIEKFWKHTPGISRRMGAGREASTLGLRPGQWPEMIVAEDADNTWRFRRSLARRSREGELRSVAYVATGNDNFTLTVWND